MMRRSPLFCPAESRRAVVLPSILTLLSVIAALAISTWPRPAGAQFRQHVVNDDTSGEENRFDPWLAPLTGGDILVFWDDNGGGHRDLVVRRFTASLQPAGEPLRVNDDGGIQDQYELSLSRPAGGRLALVWLDDRHGGGDVYAQLIDASSGAFIGANRRVTATAAAAGLRDHPAIATDARGFSLVVWEEGTFGLRRLMGQLLDASGLPVGAPRFLAAESEENIQRHPAVAALPDGRWFLAWEEATSSNYQVKSRILESDGSVAEAPRVAHQETLVDPGLGPDPAVLVRANDILLAWTDNSSGTSDVWGRWLSLDGTPQSEAALLREQTDTSRDAHVQLQPAHDNGYAVTWFGGNLNQEIPQFRLFAPDRQPLTGDLALTDQAVGVVARRGTALAMNDDASWLVSWSDDRSLSQQVYLRRVTALGLPASESRQVWSVPASASQFLPDVALLLDGRAAVVWGDLRNGSMNIFLRILDLDGKPIGQSVQVNTLPVVRRYSGPTDIDVYWPHRPYIASAPNGAFVVTWVGIVGGGTRVIYGQLYDADGQPVGDNFPVADSASQGEGQSDPRPAMGPDGSFAIGWRVQVISGEQVNDEVLIRRFDAFGSPDPGAPLNPVDVAARLVDQTSIALAISPFGDMVAAWCDRRWGGWDIYRQRLGANGQPLEPANQQVSGDDEPWSDQFNPAVATNGSSILTVWEDRPSTAGRIEGLLEILETKVGRAAAGGGAKSLLRFVVNEDHPSPGLKNPRVAMDARGRFIVVWWDEREGIRYVWARRYDEVGAPIGEAYSIIGGETRGIRQYVAVAADTATVQFAWSDARRDRGWDVYARRVDWLYGGESTPILLQEWTAESVSSGLSIRWAVPFGVEGHLFRLWRDLPGRPASDGPSRDALLVTPDWLLPSPDGRCEVLDRDAPSDELIWYFLESPGEGGSEFLGPLVARHEATSPIAAGWKLAPVPFRERLELRPPRDGAAGVTIWDVRGRLVQSRAREAGGSPLTWDGRDAAGRPVPAGLYFIRPDGAGNARLGTPLRVLRLR